MVDGTLLYHSGSLCTIKEAQGHGHGLNETIEILKQKLYSFKKILPLLLKLVPQNYLQYSSDMVPGRRTL